MKHNFEVDCSLDDMGYCKHSDHLFETSVLRILCLLSVFFLKGDKSFLSPSDSS